MVEWTRGDSEKAIAEGWDIFATAHEPEYANNIVNGKPYGHRPFELQAVSMQRDIFCCDEAAWAYVSRRAKEGNELACKALVFLQEKSPAEYEAIMRAANERE